MTDRVGVIRALEAAFNARDADRLVPLLTTDFEQVMPRGTLLGEGGVRDFLARQTYGVGVFLYGERFFERGDTVVVGGRTELRFVEDGELAEVMHDAAVYTFRDGRVARVVPWESLETALDEAGLEETDEVTRQHDA